MTLVRYYPTNKADRAVKHEWTPATDVRETEHGYELDLDLPGFEKSDFTVKVDDGVLAVTGERKRDEHKDDKLYRYYERPYGAFRRSFRIPENVSTDNIKASYVNGVLKLQLAKKEEAKPRTIEIS